MRNNSGIVQLAIERCVYDIVVDHTVPVDIMIAYITIGMRAPIGARYVDFESVVVPHWKLDHCCWRNHLGSLDRFVQKQ